MLEVGEKIHVIERRSFEGDIRRHFAGEITKARESVVTAMGYAFVFDADTDSWVRSPDLRTRIVSLVDSRVLIRLLPREAVVNDIRYEYVGRLIVTDGQFRLDVNEFDIRR